MLQHISDTVLDISILIQHHALHKIKSILKTFNLLVIAQNQSIESKSDSSKKTSATLL